MLGGEEAFTMGSSPDTTGSSEQASSDQRPGAQTPLARAWVAVALVPVFFVGAFAAETGIYALTGHEPGLGTAPRWVDLTAGLIGLAILLVPCIAGMVLGIRATRSGVRAALVPTVLAGLLGAGGIVLTILNL